MVHRQLWRPWRLLVPLRTSCRPRILIRTIYAPASHNPRQPSIAQASIVFDKAQHATPDNLIASIKPIHVSQDAKSTNKAFDQAILLLTPSFAQSLAYDSHFLHNIVNQLYRDFSAQYRSLHPTIHVAVAVIDRLPLPDSKESFKNKKPPLRDPGFEGLSYLASARPDLEVTTLNLEQENLHRDDTKTLTVVLGEDPSGLLNIRVPLASTIFQAGQPSVLSISQWVWAAESEAFVLQGRRSTPPSHVSFKYPFIGMGIPKIPLLPLTPPRKIVAGMGNVIRQIEGDDNTIITASQELEPAVTSYFTAKHLPPSAVSVWALVIPSELFRFLRAMDDNDPGKQEYLWTSSPNLSPESLKTIWQRDQTQWMKRWGALLPHGARLHRVLSGGGGWGRKAGLISLDPDSDFKNAPEADMGAMFANSDLFETQEGMLGDAAKVGDFVQFYIAPKNELQPLLPYQYQQGILPEMQPRPSIDIGTIPSTVDAMPAMHSFPSDDAAPQLGITFLNHFGFMSEKGISVAHPRHNKETEQSKQMEWRTKLTIPFSRLSWRPAYKSPNRIDYNWTPAQPKHQDLSVGTEKTPSGKKTSPSEVESSAKKSPVAKLSNRLRKLEMTRKELLLHRREKQRAKALGAGKPISGITTPPSEDDSFTAKIPEAKLSNRMRKVEKLHSQRFSRIQRSNTPLSNDYTLDFNNPIVRRLDVFDAPLGKREHALRRHLRVQERIKKQGFGEPSLVRMVKSQVSGELPLVRMVTSMGSPESVVRLQSKRQLILEERAQKVASGELPFVRKIEDQKAPDDPPVIQRQLRLLKRGSANEAVDETALLKLVEKLRRRRESLEIARAQKLVSQDRLRVRRVGNLDLKADREGNRKVGSMALVKMSRRLQRLRRRIVRSQATPVRKTLAREDPRGKPNEEQEMQHLEREPLQILRLKRWERAEEDKGVKANRRKWRGLRITRIPYDRPVWRYISMSKAPLNAPSEVDAAWTVLGKRRSRGSMGMKMRRKMEEGVGDAPSGDGTAGKKAELKKELEENEELLSTVRDLLKGF